MRDCEQEESSSEDIERKRQSTSGKIVKAKEQFGRDWENKNNSSGETGMTKNNSVEIGRKKEQFGRGWVSKKNSSGDVKRTKRAVRERL